MYKKTTAIRCRALPCVKSKLFLIMKLSVFLCLISVLQVSAYNLVAQKISMKKTNVPLTEALKEIHKQSGFSVLYNSKMLKKAIPVTVNLQNANLEDALIECFQNQPFSYVINNTTIVVTPKNVIAKPVMAITVTGNVKDEKGISLAGVTVKVKGAETAVQTNADGNFSITANDNNAVLVFSYIGFVNQEITVGTQTTINVVLKEQTSALSEVVVVGYGTQKKVNLTGAVSTVSGNNLNKRPVVNPASMLQGTMPGVQVTQGSGEPGNEGVNIQIRGNGTFSGAGSSPLVLIDGVPGSFNDINPTDIDNISVLKDAASAAIYGSRAANGVVLITTRQGKAGKMSIQYDGNFGIYKPTKLFDLITNSAQYMELYNEARINTGLNDPNDPTKLYGLYPQDQIDLYRNSTDKVNYPNTDWLSLIFKTAPTQNHNLTFNGGNDKTTYNVSLGYVNQNGIIQGFNYKKYTARINLTSKINDHIKFGTNVLLKSGTTESVAGGSKDLFLSAMSQAPTYSPYLADGSGRYTYKAYDYEYNNKNPIAVLDRKFTHDINDYAVNAQGWFEIQFNKDLSWYTKGAVNFNMDKYKDYKSTLDLYNFRTNQLATVLDLGKGLTAQDQQTVYSNLYSYLNYNHDFNGNNIKVQAGYSMEQSKYSYLQGYRQNFPDESLLELNAGGQDIQRANGTANQWALMSYFGRVNYNYKERYLFEGNMRYDGSSKFFGNNRWGVFPSFSAGWRATEESFVKNLNLGWLNNFKLRGSWGQLGNQNIVIDGYGQNYPYQALLNLTGNYSFDNANLTTGVAQGALNNPAIKWETTTMTDVGVDLTIFNNFNLTFDWYKKRTSDILRQSQVTAIVGLSAPTINDGIVDNTGMELGINYNNVIKDGALSGFTYSIGANLDRFKNKLIKYGQTDIYDYTINQNGQPISSFYMLEVAGIFQTQAEVNSSPKQFNDNTVPGDLKYKDVNNDGKIDANDRTIVGGVYPKLNYSFNLSASFKGFDFSALMQGVYGNKSYVSNWGVIPFVQGTPPTTDWLDRWTPENPSTTMPRIYWGWSAPQKLTRPSTFFLQDASYLRLKNIVLGYTLPNILTKKFGVDRLRIYFAGDNLLTITKFKGLDPERYGNGDLVQYPQNKIYSFGVNVTF
jgi:TonB-linked SusC/RagA family outer membrane protein